MEEKFVYYEITGYLPSTFVSNRIGKIVSYASKEKAIEVLEDVLKQWKAQESFNSEGLISENTLNQSYSSYQHQFVFKSCRTGMVYEITFRVVEHRIWYIR